MYGEPLVAHGSYVCYSTIDVSAVVVCGRIL